MTKIIYNIKSTLLTTRYLTRAAYGKSNFRHFVLEGNPVLEIVLKVSIRKSRVTLILFHHQVVNFVSPKKASLTLYPFMAYEI